MTSQKHLKARIRARMEKTGERYTTARRQIIGQAEPPPSTANPAARWHYPGTIPATTALRTLLSHAGVVAPHTQQPFSEAMLFGIAGGIGIGVFSFYYEREDIATFFIGGRHHWYDDLRYLRSACERLGATAGVYEAGGARAAAEHLRLALAEHGPGIVWVDMAGLPHHAAPGRQSGSNYHVISVYALDEAAGTALIGDLTDEPISIPLDALAQARARIKKDRQRVISITATTLTPSLDRLVDAGLRACHDGLLHPALPGSGPANARLAVLQRWAERMVATKGSDRWEQIYRPGPNLLRGLCAVYDFIEHYGTGGGLCRPIFADFLHEAAAALGTPALAALGETYAELGNAWSALADAALPDDVALLQTVKALLMRRAELAHAGGPAEELRRIWQQLAEAEQQAAEAFPLSAAAYGALRADLHGRIASLYAREVQAHTGLAAIIRQR